MIVIVLWTTATIADEILSDISHNVLSCSHQMESTVTLIKISDCSGFEHCRKQLGECMYTNSEKNIKLAHHKLQIWPKCM